MSKYSEQFDSCPKILKNKVISNNVYAWKVAVQAHFSGYTNLLGKTYQFSGIDFGRLGQVVRNIWKQSGIC